MLLQVVVASYDTVFPAVEQDVKDVDDNCELMHNNYPVHACESRVEQLLCYCVSQSVCQLSKFAVVHLGGVLAPPWRWLAYNQPLNPCFNSISGKELFPEPFNENQRNLSIHVQQRTMTQ